MKTHSTAMYRTLAFAFALGSTQVQAQLYNTAYGTNALSSITTGDYNSAFGEDALSANTEGQNNTAVGAGSLQFNTTGNGNTACGMLSLWSNSTGHGNTAVGSASLYWNIGSRNTANGNGSLYFNGGGHDNTASGYWSLWYNGTGNYNTAMGESALYNNDIGSGNLGIGSRALYSNFSGGYNVAIGQLAGFANQTGSFNVFIGRAAGLYETGSRKLYISSNPSVPLLYGEFSSVASENKLAVGTNTIPAGDTIAVWNGAHLTTGGVWTNASSREYKDAIRPLNAEDANAALAGLSPVRYVYKNSRDEEYLGFIAEDVPDLVAMSDRKSLSPMDIVAVLTTVTKEQKAEITTLRDSLARQEKRMLQMEMANEERMLQLEMALAEMQRQQAGELQLSSAN